MSKPSICTVQQLASQSCKPCEGGVQPFSLPDAQAQLELLAGWRLTEDGKRICKDWKFKNFVSALDFLNRVGNVAEQQQHHPDLHLESYRLVRIDIYTHAIDGLSENDFILAAKIDTLSTC